MNERNDIVTMRGNPLTLLGNDLKIGDKAPDFILSANDLSHKTLSDYNEKLLIISAVPSLDTPVCDLETKRFNKEAAGLGNDVRILTISMDLPFAQTRWCGANNIDKVETLSDYAQASFGENYGVLIKELRLLARAVFILDETRTIKYIQLVKEVTEEPDYDEILKAVKEL